MGKCELRTSDHHTAGVYTGLHMSYHNKVDYKADTITELPSWEIAAILRTSKKYILFHYVEQLCISATSKR